MAAGAEVGRAEILRACFNGNEMTHADEAKVSVDDKIRNELREEIAVLRDLFDTSLRVGLAPEDEPLLRAYADTLLKRKQLLREVEQATREP